MHLDILDWACLRIFIGVNIIALIFGALFSFCGRVAGNILTIVLDALFTFYAIAQAGFNHYLGVYMSFGTSSQLEAVADYFNEYIDSFEMKYFIFY